MPSDRFIAREDDVLDLETGIRYSTADDAEAVADLLNSIPPQPVSGDVVAAAKEIADDIAALAPIVPFDAYDALASAANRVRGLASPEPESVVIDGVVEYEPPDTDDLGVSTGNGYLYVVVPSAGEDATIFLDHDIEPGPCKVTITPIKERGE